MKINSKQKKIIIGAMIVIGLVGVFISSQENNVRNAHTRVMSAPLSIQNNIMEQKALLSEVVASIKKSGLEEAKFIQLEEIVKQIESIDYRDDEKINKNIEQIDKFNKELDKIIDIYNNDENLKKDIILLSKMEELAGLNNLIDGTMDTFNKEEVKEYNESIKKFPSSIIAKVKGLNTINKFTSINQ